MAVGTCVPRLADHPKIVAHRTLARSGAASQGSNDKPIGREESTARRTALGSTIVPTLYEPVRFRSERATDGILVARIGGIGGCGGGGRDFLNVAVGVVDAID